MFAALYVGKIYFVLVDAYLSYLIRMRTGKVSDFGHHFAVELQIHHMWSRIGKNGHRLLKTAQSLGIEGYVYRSFSAGGDRCLCPSGIRTGAVGLHFAQDKRLVACIGNGILHRDGMLPLNLSQMLHLGTRREACLSCGTCHKARTKGYQGKYSFHP